MSLVIYTEMLNYGPDLLLLELRADTYDRLGIFDAAISDYLAAVGLGEKDAKILNNLYWDLGITNQAEEALLFCEQVVEADPSSQNRDSHGLTYALLGNSQEAIDDFQAVVDDLKDTTDARRLQQLVKRRLAM
jgi:tetratricopeptide (TPR) repeat protein